MNKYVIKVISRMRSRCIVVGLVVLLTVIIWTVCKQTYAPGDDISEPGSPSYWRLIETCEALRENNPCLLGTVRPLQVYPWLEERQGTIVEALRLLEDPDFVIGLGADYAESSAIRLQTFRALERTLTAMITCNAMPAEDAYLALLRLCASGARSGTMLDCYESMLSYCRIIELLVGNAHEIDSLSCKIISHEINLLWSCMNSVDEVAQRERGYDRVLGKHTSVWQVARELWIRKGIVRSPDTAFVRRVSALRKITDGRTRLAVRMLALRGYYLEHGEYPADIAFVPHPDDKEILDEHCFYEREGQGYVLFDLNSGVELCMDHAGCGKIRD